MEGLLLINKAPGYSSFDVVRMVRRATGEKTVGHAGTLDPFATGVLVLLIGRTYTQKSNTFLSADKTYQAEIHLGIETDTYDLDGTSVSTSPIIPSLDAVEKALSQFQGEILQTPPMYSAKKVQGKKLYELARAGISIERRPSLVHLSIDLLSYAFPFLHLKIHCSKGTYIRSLAHDLGQVLGCGGHLSSLTRLASGNFSIEECLPQEKLSDPTLPIQSHLRTL